MNATSRPPALRRQEGGTRHEASRRVSLRVQGESTVFDGWTLNLSRGGARVVLVEDDGASVIEGCACTVEIDGDPQSPRQANIVWVQNEPDGQIAGVKFVDNEGEPVP